MSSTLMNEKKKHPSALRTGLMMVVNPIGAMKQQLEKINWKLTLIVPGLAFSILFFQTGLDLTGKIGLITILLTLLGCIYGGAGVFALANLCALIAMNSNSEIKEKSTVITAFSLGYTGTMIYQVFGLIFALSLGWNTSVAFGVSGMLIALRPMMAVIRKISGNLAVGVVLSTICGMVLIFGWALLGLISV